MGIEGRGGRRGCASSLPVSTAGRVGLVKEIRTMSESTALMPSMRYCGLKATFISLPSKVASIASVACASSPVPPRAAPRSWRR